MQISLSEAEQAALLGLWMPRCARLPLSELPGCAVSAVTASLRNRQKEQFCRWQDGENQFVLPFPNGEGCGKGKLPHITLSLTHLCWEKGEFLTLPGITRQILDSLFFFLGRQKEELIFPVRCLS